MSDRKYVVEATFFVSEDDVWDYLESQGEDVDELQEQGYELTNEDWENTAHDLMLDDDFNDFTFDTPREIR